MTRRVFWIVLCVLSVSACSRDPWRDVKPMSPPLTRAGTTSSSSDIMPMDAVSKSQAAAVSQRIANTDITLTYSRPVARGRQLFGSLVPFGDVWNPGADQATALAASRDITVNGGSLPAGKYSVWAIPRTDNWTLILSTAAEVFHTPYPGAAQDALRVDVRPEQGAHMEALSSYFPTVEGKDAVLRFHWGTTVIPLAITVP